MIAPHNPDVVLANATTALVTQRGILDSATLDAVKRASQAAPLDARAYLVLGHQQLLDDQPQRAVATLEAGQRLDPRERLIHVLLVDRYLRTNRYTEAAEQFSILSRLAEEVQGPIATAMAQFVLDPQTRESVRRTLATDANLERSVLFTLAKSDTAPATIFALASPAAKKGAASSDSWGPALVNRLVSKGQYATARSVWQTIFGFTPAQVAPPVYDAGFRQQRGSPPFNWILTSNSLGAADMRDGALSVTYYGRDTGELVSQLLLLAPGTYKFAITIEGSKTGPGPWLAWSLRCANGDKAEVMTLKTTGTGARHRVAAAFTVPVNCPAQQLSLTGNAGEFPEQIDLTLSNLDLRPVAENQK